jgi:hypothetical protein
VKSHSKIIDEAVNIAHALQESALRQGPSQGIRDISFLPLNFYARCGEVVALKRPRDPARLADTIGPPGRADDGRVP